MPDFVTLSCPTCGGQLQITNDIDRFACSHCGNEHLVNRAGGIVSIRPVVEGLQRVQAGVDRTAAEPAIRRLREDLTAIEVQRKQLKTELYYLGVNSSLLGNPRKKQIRQTLSELEALAPTLKAELEEQLRVIKS
jgi:hypothetical protein